MKLDRGNRFFRGLAVVSTAGLGLLSYLYYDTNQAQDAANQKARHAAIQQSYERDVAVRQGQIQNCQIIGEPIRHAQIRDAKQTVSDIKEQHQRAKAAHINYHKLFPNFDRKKLKRLIKQGKDQDAATVEAEQRIINTLQAVPPCDQRYPPVPQPVFPH